MNEEPTKDLSQRAFQLRVLNEFAAIRRDIGELRTQQTAMAKNIGGLDNRLTTVEQRLTSVDQRLTSVDKRLTSLEEKVDSRLKETRPIWEAVKAQIEKLDAKFDNFVRDLFDLRGDLRLHEKRLDNLERRVLS